MQLPIGREQPLSILVTESDSGILDGEANEFRLRQGFGKLHPQTDRTSVGEFHRIAEQIVLYSLVCDAYAQIPTQ